MTGQNTKQSLTTRYKKWILASLGIYLIPTILMLGGMIAGFIYTYMNNDTHFHPYKSYIEQGFRDGHSDGAKDHIMGSKIPWSLWLKYDCDTDKLKKKAALEQEEYLSQLPESERGMQLAEMKLNNIKLPLQLELAKRFTSGLAFYADYVKQRVNRESFKSDKEYHEALENEAWKAGYAFGYREGLAGYSYNTARLSLKY